jgi:hypothetical protein
MRITMGGTRKLITLARTTLLTTQQELSRKKNLLIT